MEDEIFQFKWNGHQSSLSHIADDLLSSGAFVDCALVADGRCIDVHKLILSACSPYLRSLLNYQSSGRYHGAVPVIVLKDISFDHLTLIVEYMYKGIVSLPFSQIGLFLEAAEILQIRGLTVKDRSGPVKTESPPSTSEEAEPQPPQLTPETYAEPKLPKESSLPATSFIPDAPTESQIGRKVTKRKPRRKTKLALPPPPPPPTPPPPPVPPVPEETPVRAVQYSVDLTQDDDDDEVTFTQCTTVVDVVTVYDDDEKMFTEKVPVKGLKHGAAGDTGSSTASSDHYVPVISEAENEFSSSPKVDCDTTTRSAIEDVVFSDARRVTRSLKILRPETACGKRDGGLKVESFADQCTPAKPTRKPRKHREAVRRSSSASDCPPVGQEADDGPAKSRTEDSSASEPQTKIQESSSSSVCDKPSTSQQPSPNKPDDHLLPNDCAETYTANGRQLRSRKRSFIDVPFEQPKLKSGGKRKKSKPRKSACESVNLSDAESQSAETSRKPSNAESTDENETKGGCLPC